jgi:ElaB/YqjD/DUF883 family membrane-anchored ribosome-binding protein
MSKPALKLKTISRGLDDLAENMNSALEFAGAGAAEQTENALADTAKALSRTARSMAKQARKFGKRAGKKATRGLNEHPMAAAVIAASAAALIGALLVTKSRSAA